MMKVRISALCAAVAFLIQSASYGGTVSISGSGTWDANIDSNGIYSAPNAPWSFSFEVESPIDPATRTGAVTNGQYFLNGLLVADPIATVTFFPSNQLGLFDLNFASGVIVSLYGAQAFDEGFNLIAGYYPAQSQDISTATGNPNLGTGFVLVTVPEPSSFLLSVIAIAAGTGIARHRRRNLAA
ncbi:MAG: hypothetical protein ABS79_06380 [Planctomycetes bacterium SCN 63-9]|nr:MAG: hypothetical protein ABS79_06380 [Planctomycetes bacterium SCN 63-9]